jgi:hypothetical protein
MAATVCIVSPLAPAFPLTLTSIWEAFPTWQDEGSRIEARTKTGEIVTGTLRCVDVGFDGREWYPVFAVIAGNHEDASFFDFESYRKL